MIFRPTTIAGAFTVELEPRTDDRGSFARAFCLREFKAAGIEFSVAQCNLARTKHAGTVRGLHYVPPDKEQKFVRCVAGGVYDVMIDMRPGSPTLHKVFQVELSSANRLALFVPGGVAHGYQTLADETEFLYMTDEFYVPGMEQGVCYNDPALGVQWPLPPANVAPRDTEWPHVKTK
ncbi:MAG: dTDP-4-dehydrorhamnose 3,5-epimerase family protein [Nibricoccus sp.]